MLKLMNCRENIAPDFASVVRTCFNHFVATMCWHSGSNAIELPNYLVIHVTYRTAKTTIKAAY
jgi:hypothetical protein